MTPKQRMQAKKEQEIKRREEELKMAAHGAKHNYAQAKFAKMNNAHDSMKRSDQIYTEIS